LQQLGVGAAGGGGESCWLLVAGCWFGGQWALIGIGPQRDAEEHAEKRSSPGGLLRSSAIPIAPL
nr:hypothetical protein [Tanacetum cinerariifolium]